MMLCVLAAAAPLSAQMAEVGDEELSRIIAQAGINLNIGNSKLRLAVDSLRYSDTDHDPKHWIRLDNLAVSGPGGYFSLDCPVDYPITLDIGTATTIDDQHRTVINLQLSEHVTPRTWGVGNFVFCDQDLGSLLVDTSTVDPSDLRISSHLWQGSSGIDFEYLTKWRTQDFSYAYNTSGGSLHASGIYLAERASGASDSPGDPTTWEFSGKFRIGDLLGGQIDVDNDPLNASAPNPAMFDVATEDTNTSIYVSLPLKGTVRVADVNLGGRDFGPVAIDGITAHHMLIKLDPGI